MEMRQAPGAFVSSRAMLSEKATMHAWQQLTMLLIVIILSASCPSICLSGHHSFADSSTLLLHEVRAEGQLKTSLIHQDVL